MFKKILIANRGEVAVRILRACRELRISSVAVYSDVDKEALHVQRADESFPLGDPAPLQSYLNIPKLMDAAKKTGSQAIHPGYGFLSENASFAEACEKEGIVFIGPSSSVIYQMGDKIGAKKFLSGHGIPVIPGEASPLQEVGDAKKRAKSVGYPVLLKAAAGGGGKGMRIVHEEKDLGDALEGCRREAKNAFGDDRIFLEKYLEGPRHIEFQIIADDQGDVRHLFERECSIQRRHQKVIEETPSVALDDELRSRMGDVAVKIGQLIGYRSLGTVEFVLDREKKFYFLEVNTRLQVEHPITEMTTGIDLVRAQIRISSGESLQKIIGSFNKAQRAVEGEAPRALPVEGGKSKLGFDAQSAEGGWSTMTRAPSIECRICAEDPEQNFLPSPGRITKLREPRGEGIRLDTGVFEGWNIPFEYDPMLAKLIVHASTREQAIVKMIRALGDFCIEGVKTNIPLLIDLLRHPDFIAGHTDTGFIPRNFPMWSQGYFDPIDPFNPWTTLFWDKARRAVEGGAPRARPVGGATRAPIKDHDLTAPMPGTVQKILVQEGQSVKRGDILVIMEAMKMEHSISSPDDGRVKKIFHGVGDKVGMGEKLVEIA